MNMSFKLEDIKGLGKKTVDTLKEAGIDSVEKLANSTLEDLREIKGIGKASAEKYIEQAKELLEESTEQEKEEEKEGELTAEEKEAEEIDEEEQKQIEEERKKLEEKKKKLKGKKVEEGDFILVKVTGKTQKGNVFRVSSEEDAKTAGIYDEQKAKQGYYTPEFVIVGKPGFLNEGLTEVIQDMEYFEKKSVRIPPSKAFGKRDPQKIERVGIAKYRRMNNGKSPELGQEFQNKKGQQGVITSIRQGKVMIDYNHPLAGQSVDYNIEIVDKIEEFDEKIEYFILNKGIPKDNIKEFTINYHEEEKTLEITVPKMFLFQNLTYVKFGIAYDLQTYMPDDIGDVKFIEVYEKMAPPMEGAPEESVMQKVEAYNKEQEESSDTEETEENTE